MRLKRFDKNFTVRLSKKQRTFLEQEAKTRLMTVGELVRDFIDRLRGAK